VLSVKTLHNLSNLAATEAPQELRLEGRDLVALYALNSGMNKPAILNRYGDALVEFSGWNSSVSVDGIGADLWTHAFHVELDRERTRAFLDWSSVPLRQDVPQDRRMLKYQVEQVVSLSGNGAVVEYYFVPNEPMRDVDLTVGLYKWYYQNLTRTGDRFSFVSTDLGRLETEQRMLPRRDTPVLVRSSTPAQSVQTLANEFGVYAIDFSYTAHSPKIYERTLLARLEVIMAQGPQSR